MVGARGGGGGGKKQGLAFNLSLDTRNIPGGVLITITHRASRVAWHVVSSSLHKNPCKPPPPNTSISCLLVAPSFWSN